MATRKKQGSFQLASQLKPLLEAAGFKTELHTDGVYYDGSTIQILLHGQFPSGKFRATVLTSGNTSFDVINMDADLVKVWTADELVDMIALTPGVSFSDNVFANNTYTHTITWNDEDYIGADSDLVNAMSKAFIDVLEAGAIAEGRMMPSRKALKR